MSCLSNVNQKGAEMPEENEPEDVDLRKLRAMWRRLERLLVVEVVL
jgi:hypothetical protein